MSATSDSGGAVDRCGSCVSTSIPERPMLLREAFIDAFNIDDLNDLPRHLFDDAIRHLAGFVGAN